MRLPVVRHFDSLFPDRSRYRLWSLWLLPLMVGCSLLDTQPSAYSYNNPPSINSVLRPQLDLVFCQSTTGARFMAETGFFAADCRRHTPATPYTVLSREHIQLKEGGLWLLRVKNEAHEVWVPLPWHNWA